MTYEGEGTLQLPDTKSDLSNKISSCHAVQQQNGCYGAVQLNSQLKVKRILLQLLFSWYLTTQRAYGEAGIELVIC